MNLTHQIKTSFSFSSLSLPHNLTYSFKLKILIDFFADKFASRKLQISLLSRTNSAYQPNRISFVLNYITQKAKIFAQIQYCLLNGLFAVIHTFTSWIHFLCGAQIECKKEYDLHNCKFLPSLCF